MAFKWIDPYLHLQDKLGIKVLLGIAALTMLLLGTFIHMETLRFEMYGNDFKKRGILNQVIQKISMSLTLSTYSGVYIAGITDVWGNCACQLADTASGHVENHHSAS